MNVLVLQPTHSVLLYNVITEGGKTHQKSRRLKQSASALAELAQKLHASKIQIDLIAVKGKYGGQEFKQPVAVTPEVLARLEKLSFEAPLHVPELIHFLKHAADVFTRQTIVLVF